MVIATLALGSEAIANGWPIGQPLLPVWKPSSGDNSLLDYDFKADPDAPFARGAVALADRVPVPRPTNTNARAGEARVMVLATSGYSCSDTAAQSYGFASAYCFSFWQYIDAMVYWGGSAGEGNILSPHPGVIDAAHRNGVPVYGTIFFPPNEFGGTIDRVDDMLAQEPDGSFPVADQLIEAMRVNGFDGYFINQETVGGDRQTADQMRAFMKYFQRTAGSGRELVWYDAMTESGKVRWQEQLNDRNDGFFQSEGGVVSEKMFLDFGWNAVGLDATREHARALGRSEFDLYAAVNVEGVGYNQRVNWPAVFPRREAHRTSLALFVPTWTWTHSRGATSQQRVADYRSRESRLWVGAVGDPSDTADTVGKGNWRGVAHNVPAMTPVIGDTFLTNFNLGQGFQYFIDGELVSTTAWTNLSVQDVLPTWRWVVETESANALRASLDHGDAYCGGTSLRVRGVLDAPNDLRLYATRLNVHADSRFSIAFKTGMAGKPSNMQVAFAFEDDPSKFTASFDVGGTESNGWETAEFNLSELAGRTISQVGLRFIGSGEPTHDIRVGRIALARGDRSAPAPPSNPRLLSAAQRDEALTTLRVAWAPSTDKVRHYEVFQVGSDGSLVFLDASSGPVCFVRCDRLDPSDATVNIEVVAVGPDFSRSEPVGLICPLPTR